MNLLKITPDYHAAVIEAETKLEELREAVRAYRDAKGRYHTQKSCEHLLSLLPENETNPAAGSTRKDHE